MILSDISIKRPVLATVVSLLLVAFGTVSFLNLPLRELPDIDAPVVSVTTTYRGAAASVIDNRITQVIENQISGIEGIDNIQSQSRDGRSQVTIEFTLGRDIEAATNDVRNAVARVADDLPDGVEPPEVTKQDADAEPVMFLHLSSEQMSRMELTDYARRFLVDRLGTLPGVARVNAFGEEQAMRIWIDRTALAARGLTVGDIEAALRAENIELPAGRVESTTRNLSIRIERGYVTPDDFRELVIRRTQDGHLVRLGEVARVELAPEERRSDFRGNGKPQVGIGVVRQSTANLIDVARAIRDEIDRMQSSLPPGMELVVAVDTSVFVEESIAQVYKTLIEAAILVIAVIFLFLGNFRAALIPAVTVPVCLIGACTLIYAFGLSINTVTLLALILAIGLVVDDAIVVLENAQRRVDLGEPPLVAAYRGTRQVAFAVLATTAVLITVFVPIIFLGGNVGRLFSELAVAMAAAIAFSALVALTLSPMMCSQLLRPTATDRGLSRLVLSTSDRLARAYGRSLRVALAAPVAVMGFFGLTIAGAAVLFASIPSELTPPEDRGIFDINVQAPEGAGYDYMHAQALDLEQRLLKYVDNGTARRIVIRVPGGFGATEDFNSARAIFVLQPWSERPPLNDVVTQINRELAPLTAVRAQATARQGFGRGGGGNPVQFVIGGSDYAELAEWRDRILARARANPNLVNPDSDYRESRPQVRVQIDQTRAADLGVSTQAIGRTLEALLGQRRVGTFLDRGEEYDVILQGVDEDRRSPAALQNVFVRSERTGELIPLSNLVTIEERAAPATLNRYNRLRAITISASLAQGYTLGEALTFLEEAARAELPPTAQIDYRGQSRELKQTSGALYVTFAMALLVVFLVLAAQFESFVHPTVIMVTVPLAVTGALMGLWFMGSSLNIYSQIGIVMLIGLAAKNGILIVEFINQLRDAGREFRDAVVEASMIRLRPVLMTSMATALGALPLVLSGGAGAGSRQTIGIVVFAGVIFSTLLTLYVVPVLYDLIARRTGSPNRIARELEAFDSSIPDRAAGAH